jgi:hypothetical protein
MRMTTSVLEKHSTFVPTRQKYTKLGKEQVTWGRPISGSEEEEVKGP